MNIDNKESIRYAVISFLESFYHFFGRRFQGGLIDDVVKNTRNVRKVFLERPNFIENVTFKMGTTTYDIQIFGKELVDNYHFSPTVRVAKITDRYWKPVIESMINIAYVSDDNVEIEFVSNAPITIKDIYTRNQLRKWFGWTERDLNAFYKFIGQYLVKVL